MKEKISKLVDQIRNNEDENIFVLYNKDCGDRFTGSSNGSIHNYNAMVDQLLDTMNSNIDIAMMVCEACDQFHSKENLTTQIKKITNELLDRLNKKKSCDTKEQTPPKRYRKFRRNRN